MTEGKRGRAKYKKFNSKKSFFDEISIFDNFVDNFPLAEKRKIADTNFKIYLYYSASKHMLSKKIRVYKLNFNIFLNLYRLV